MVSSESTPTLPEEPTIWLGVILRGDDHPKACTGRRLLDWKKVHRLPPRGGRTPRLLLDPHAARILSRADEGTAREGGVVVVDCSWNQLALRPQALDRSTTPDSRFLPRRLPLLLAANPQHFGRLSELNTVEAFAAALYLLGAPRAANGILGGFRGGTTFLTLNQDRLEAYRQAASSEQMAALERRLFGGAGYSGTGSKVTRSSPPTDSTGPSRGRRAAMTRPRSA
jgi:pre-rRNA-processing protein TSR3